MIAITPTRRQRRSSKRRIDERFLKMLPAIRRQAHIAFGHLDREQREELTAEVVANAFVAFRRLADRGKLHVAFATPLTDFAIRQIRAGRRVGGRLNVRDVTSRHCQLRKHVCMQRLDHYNWKKHEWREASKRCLTSASVSSCL